MVEAKVVDMRVVDRDRLKAFFSVILGFTDEEGEFQAVVSIRDMALKTGRNGLYFQWPSKLRTKNGEPVKERGTDGKEYNKYDNIVDLAFTGEGASRTASPAAWDLRDEIQQQAAATFADLEKSTSRANKGRGAEAPAKAKEKPSKRSVPPPPVDEDDDDELPF